MNIIHVLPVPGFYSMHNGMGGHVSHAYGIIEGLVKCGCSVRTLAAESSHDIRRLCVRSTIVPFRGGIFGRQWWSKLLMNRLELMCQKQRPDVVYIRYSQQFAWWLPTLRRIVSPAKVILEVNSFASQRWRFAAVLESRLFKYADVILAVSNNVADGLKSILPQTIRPSILILPNGVDTARFEGVAPRKLPPGEGFDVAYLGIFKHGHGLEDVIACARRLGKTAPGVIFHLVGTGPSLRYLQRLARGVNNLRFHGAIPFEDVPAVLKGMDILLYTTSPSLVFQSPIKLLEYMAAERAIVSMRTPFTEWLLDNGAAGMLIPIGDVGALEAAIMTLWRDPDKRESYGRLAAKCVSGHTWECRARELMLHLQLQEW